MKTTVTTAVTVLILVMMSGIAIADDQPRRMMSSDCPECVDCIDVIDAMENLPFAQFDAMVTIATSGIVIEEEWAYERRNVAPDGIEHAYWDFEEGSNLYPFKNVHPNIASFENVSNARCFGNNEPSYVRKGANCGPRCRCKMHIYPYNTKFDNGTPFPYIHIVNGDAAFSPRAVVGGMQCYYPACSAFVIFKDDTEFVSFLTSTGWNLYVRAYDKRWNYLGGSTIYCTTKRVDDDPSNFTRFTMHLPDKEIRYMTFSGPFNGWHIDDLIVGGEAGYLGLRRDYGYAAERMKELIGAPYNEFGVGFEMIGRYFNTADEIINDDLLCYNPYTEEVFYAPGIYDQYAIVRAFNEENDVIDHIVNHYDITDLAKHDFKTEVAYEDIQPGDVFFIDYPYEDPKTGLWVPDGQYDEVGVVVPGQYDPETGMYEDCIRVIEDGGVQYSSTEFVNTLYGNSGFVHYRTLPDDPKGSKCPYPKPKGKPI